MNDIIPPPKKRPLSPPPATPVQSPLPVEAAPEGATIPPLVPEAVPQKSKRKRIWWVFSIILLIGIGAIGAVGAWYVVSLQPRNVHDTSRTRITINEGSSPSSIAAQLQDKNLIRNKWAFDLYIRLSGAHSELQAGLYSISPSESVATIVQHLVAGKVDQSSLTFLPGATVTEDKAALQKAGYSQKEIDAAFTKTYNHALFADKPASADLEGYIFGETYHFKGDATVEQILTTTFDEYYAALERENLIEGFKAQGLNLYQGITLASIIQREVPNADDQKQVAQIFLKRLSINMPLGSDVTYQYAAKQLGVSPSPGLDSPYNTRKYPGLPPGPIASPGLTALEAVAHPADGDYLYFLSGDDGITYFAKTADEHEANIRDHCQVKCANP